MESCASMCKLRLIGIEHLRVDVILVVIFFASCSDRSSLLDYHLATVFFSAWTAKMCSVGAVYLLQESKLVLMTMIQQV